MRNVWLILLFSLFLAACGTSPSAKAGGSLTPAAAPRYEEFRPSLCPCRGRAHP